MSIRQVNQPHGISAVQQQGDFTMTKKTAVKILMMSPIYFRLDIRERMELVQEFLRLNSSTLNIEDIN